MNAAVAHERSRLDYHDARVVLAASPEFAFFDRAVATILYQYSVPVIAVRFATPDLHLGFGADPDARSYISPKIAVLNYSGCLVLEDHPGPIRIVHLGVADQELRAGCQDPREFLASSPDFASLEGDFGG